jgi:hypothetical protein
MEFAVIPDPVMSAVAAAVAGKAADAAMQGGKDACAALLRLVRERFGRGTDAANALETARNNPDDEAALAGIAAALEQLAADDAGFAAHLRELWAQATVELTATEGGVANSVTGSAGGHLMQARDLHVDGGLHFGDIRGTSQ